MTAADDLTDIATDLHTVGDLLRWCEGAAWWPAGRALDAPRGRALTQPVDENNPDHVPGPTFALGVGDHRSQAALRTALAHLETVESKLRVTHVSLVVQGVAPPETLVRRDAGRPLALLANIRWLVVRIGSLGPVPLSSGQKRLIGDARREIDQAWRTLYAATSTGKGGPDTHATAAKDRCVICDLRPRAAKKGKRCHTCFQWFSRNGYERPRKLDTVEDATTAQKRRRAHGYGWGDESLSSTDRPPIHDCTCTPTERCDNHGETPDPASRVTCGTPQGYLDHRRNHHPPCGPCTRAWADSRDAIREMIRTRHLEAS